MSISVIIPTLEAGASLGQLLSALLAQDMPPSEILVIDSSSTDNTVSIAQRSGARTIVIPRHDFNHGQTRNRAAMEARGDILVFMTQDALPENKNLLAMLTKPLQTPDIAATYGRHVPRPDAPPPEVFARHFNYPEKGMVKGLSDTKRLGIRTFLFSNVCSSIKKELFLKAGMFPGRVRANEDMLIAAKLIVNGYRIAYVPEAAVIHSHNCSLLQQFIRYFNIGSSLRHNRWILKYARAEGEGIRFARQQLQFIIDRKKYAWIPYIIMEFITKYAGFRIGLIAG